MHKNEVIDEIFKTAEQFKKTPGRLRWRDGLDIDLLKHLLHAKAVTIRVTDQQGSLSRVLPLFIVLLFVRCQVPGGSL